MKMTPFPKILTVGIGVAIAGLSFHSAQAASATWTGATDATWAGTGNWTATPVPGTGDTAGFVNSAATVNSNTTIDLGTGVTVGTVLFDTANAAAYTIGSGGAGAETLTLSDTTAAITMTSTVANTETFNANIVLGTALVGTTTVTNATAAQNITFNGTITGGTGGTAGIKTFNLLLSTGSTASITNAVTAGGSTGIGLAVAGSGNSDTTHQGVLTLSGNVSSSLRTLTASGGGSVVINGQTVTVSTLSNYGATTTYGKFILNSGSVAFNGGVGSATSSGVPAGADGMAVIVNNGTFSAASVTMGRSQNTGSSTTFNTSAINMGTSGFQVNGGTANVTGAARLYGGGSSATGQVSGGSLTVGGELTIGESGTRTSLFQVTGGTLTDTDTVGNGIVIAKGATTLAAAGQLLLTGGTTTTEKVSFGLASGLAGSTGNLTINGANASLYVGSGGIVNNATNSFTLAINLTNGTIGAKADWSSSLNAALNGTAGNSFTFQAADASSVAHNIALSGVLSGTGGLVKTGAGNLTLSGSNTYTGATTVNAGALVLGGNTAIPTASAVTLNGGTLKLVTTAAISEGSSTAAGTGAFTLASTSVIDYGSSNANSGLLHFADSSATTWNGTLSIYNWNAATDSLYFGLTDSGLTSTQLADIRFYSDSGSTLLGTAAFVGSNNGQVIVASAVPEPSVGVMLLSGFGLLGMFKSRRRSL
ncbi:MAG: autotransporter-associated beta strand repeat-containing protein [Chthoniobacteraceae bacterium]